MSSPQSSDGAVLRGSVVLLGGRVMSMAAGLLTNFLIIRGLSGSEYDDWAFALIVAALVQSFLALGFDRTDTRFLALYDEQGDPGRVVGTVATELLVVAVTGALSLAVLAPLAFGGVFYPSVPPVVMVALLCTAPLLASDSLVLNAFAVFARPTAVFVRRYVIDPLLRLSVVVVLLTTGMDVERLAIGYATVGALASTLYLVLLARLLKRVVARSRAPYRFTWPGRVLFAAALPLLSAAVMYSATTALPGIVAQHLGPEGAVGALRAVQPLAAMNVIVPTVFGTLFLPRAARLVARGEHSVLRTHYWTTAVWVGVLTFPLATVGVSFARPVTDLYTSGRYADQWPVLAVMAVAYFLNTSLGLNSSVLQVAGKIKVITVTNLVGLVLAGAVSVALVPPFGAVGAAVGVAVAIAVPQLTKQWALRSLGIGAAHPAAVRMWVSAVVLLAACAVVEALARPNVLVALGVGAVASLVHLVVMRNHLALDETLPAGLVKPVAKLLRLRMPAPRTDSAHGDGGSDGPDADGNGAAARAAATDR